jgi:hypothetical protein
MLYNVSLIHTSGRMYAPLKYIDPSGCSWLSKLSSAIGNFIKSSVNIILGAALVVIDALVCPFFSVLGAKLIGWGFSIMLSPVQVTYSDGKVGVWVGFGFAPDKPPPTPGRWLWGTSRSNQAPLDQLRRQGVPVLQAGAEAGVAPKSTLTLWQRLWR